MSRLIDADALKTAIDNGWKPDMMVTEIWDIIDEMPTVEATSIRIGHWVDQGKDLEAHSMEVLDAWSCSRCRYYIHGNGYPKWKYCPMCGCRMKEADQ